MKSFQRNYWFQVLAWTAFIYLTLPFAQSLTQFLTQFIPISIAVNVLYVLALIFLLFLLHKIKIRFRSTYLILIVLATVMIHLLKSMTIPIEKIHFLEYGFLAFLIHKALQAKTNKVLAYLLAFLLTAALGWGDEGIQYLLPGRYYDLRDVLYNTLGGFLGLWITFAVRRERGLQQRQLTSNP
ncbi:MAG: VanZ family protein [Candidatus Omnitrophota bacterium]